MVKVLIVKTSSMGDVIHTLPALTDAAHIMPDIEFDWVVEPSFAEIPSWHTHVQNIIPLSYRKWRKHIFQTLHSNEFNQFLRQLRQQRYDLIIDAQGLYKSAVIACLAKGQRHGYDRQSAREPLATFCYQQQHPVSRQLHAIDRIRQLFALTLGYSLPVNNPNYGIDFKRMQPTTIDIKHPYLVFLHGTTWATKHWPELYWQSLIELATTADYTVVLPWGNEAEKMRAQRLTQHNSRAQLLPRLSLGEIGTVLANASGVVSVDSGLGHLAAALSVPSVILYGPTDPNKIGTLGRNQCHLKDLTANCTQCSRDQCRQLQGHDATPNCFSALTADKVWRSLREFF